MALTQRSEFDTARRLLALGYSVIPSGAGPKGKFPLVRWFPYQKRIPTDDELGGWQNTLRPQLWGIVTGAVSGIVILDADGPRATSLSENAGLSPTVFTPRCANFWFRHPGHHVKTVAGILPELDVRGDGGFANVVGTRTDGGTYRINRWPTPDSLYRWIPSCTRP